MYAPYPENMMESIKKVEATRAQRMATEPRRLTADEKDALLKKFHPDYNPDAFAEIKVGPNKGQKAPLELAEMLHSESRLMNEKIDLNKDEMEVLIADYHMNEPEFSDLMSGILYDMLQGTWKKGKKYGTKVYSL